VVVTWVNDIYGPSTPALRTDSKKERGLENDQATLPQSCSSAALLYYCVWSLKTVTLRGCVVLLVLGAKKTTMIVLLQAY
jgi:hypothetical protein